MWRVEENTFQIQREIQLGGNLHWLFWSTTTTKLELYTTLANTSLLSAVTAEQSVLQAKDLHKHGMVYSCIFVTQITK